MPKEYYRSLRESIGFPTGVGKTLFGLLNKDDLKLNNLIKQYTGTEIILISDNLFSRNKVNDYEGCDFDLGTIKKIEENHIWLKDKHFAIGSHGLYDIIPVSSVSSVMNKNYAPKWIYTFYHDLGGEYSETTRIIHADPILAFMSAIGKTQSKSQTLRKIESVVSGYTFLENKSPSRSDD
jgi:hypothetical protein